MRIPVSDILELLSAGAPVEDILADQPDLKREDLLAAAEDGEGRVGVFSGETLIEFEGSNCYTCRKRG